MNGSIHLIWILDTNDTVSLSILIGWGNFGVKFCWFQIHVDQAAWYGLLQTVQYGMYNFHVPSEDITK